MAMTDLPDRGVAHNIRSLTALTRTIQLSQGQFSLILARCNYSNLRQSMIQALHDRLAQPTQVLYLPESAKTLYSLIQTVLPPEQSGLAAEGSQFPAALQVLGLEAVTDLEPLLTSALIARDEFRKHCPFPLVLWVNDRVFQKLSTLAPDFKGWATTLRFEMTLTDLVRSLKSHVDRLFASILVAGDEQFPPNWAVSPIAPVIRRTELDFALEDLNRTGQALDPELQAGLDFLQGQTAHMSGEIETARDYYERSLAFWMETEELEETAEAAPADPWATPLPAPHSHVPYLTPHPGYVLTPSSLERQACVLVYLGLLWRSYAVLQRSLYSAACRYAASYFQRSLELFEQENRQDLVAKFIITQAEVLQKLGQWEDLQSLAQKALILHKLYHHPVRQSRDHGFLAEVAIAQQDWLRAKRHIEAALRILEITEERLAQADVADPTIATSLALAHHYYSGWFLLLLATAESNLGQANRAIVQLTEALNRSQPQTDPQLYIRILQTLRNLYFQQQQYREAFQLKCTQRIVEHQYRFRAFVGALRLEAQPTPLDLPSWPVDLNPETLIAQEMATSGRQRDIHALLARLGRSDYKLTVIHGPSGVGKSSIIHAGLLPALHDRCLGDRPVWPVVQDLYTDWDVALVRKFQANQAVTLEPIPTDAPSQPQLIPLLRRAIAQNQSPVLIFDQFEEFFFVCETLAQRRPFYEFLRDCLELEFVKILLLVREDYLHYLLEFQRFTELHPLPNRTLPDSVNDILGQDVRYPLRDFSPADAKAVIHHLTTQAQFFLADDLVDELVGDLAGELGEIRPIELQVVGAQLQAEGIQTLAAYRQRGPKAKLVARSLRDVVRDCGAENEQAARIVLFLLTHANGTRPLKTRDELAAELIAFDLAEELPRLDLVLEVLRGSGLIFLVPELPDDRYQLVHDYLIPFIREQKQTAFLMDVGQERQRRRLAEERQQASEMHLNQALARLNQVLQQRLKWSRVGLIGLTGCILLMGLGWLQAWVGRNNAEISSLTASAESLRLSQLELDALLEGVRLADRLRPHALTPMLPIQASVRLAAIATLQQIFYQMHEYQRLQSHSDRVLSTQFSPDGQTIATTSADQTIKLWSRDGHLLRTLTGHQDMVVAVSVSPDGQRLASASWDGTVKLWTLQGQLLQTLPGGGGSVLDVRFSPDGQTIVSAGGGSIIRRWTADGQPLFPLQGHSGSVSSLCFSADGQTIATADLTGVIKLWRRDGQLLQSWSAHAQGITDLSFSPDGQSLVSASQDHTLKRWSRSGQELHVYRGHTASVNSVRFSPDGQHLASASSDATVRLWHLEGSKVVTLRGHGGPVYSVRFSPDGQTIASAGADWMVKLWRWAGVPLPRLRGHTQVINSVLFSRDGHTVMTASDDRTIRLWQAGAMKLLVTATSEVNSISLSPDGQTIAAGYRNGQIQIWDGQGHLQQTWTGHPASVNWVSFSPDGQTIASASSDHSIKLWNRTGNLLTTLQGHQADVLSLRFSPDGRTIASSSRDHTIKLWHRDGHLEKTLIGHQDQVFDLAFSLNGQTIASASADRTIKLWNRAGQKIRTLKGHNESVYTVVFSPTGDLLASGSGDGQIKLWSQAGRELKTLPGHADTAPVYSLAFSPDGQQLASASWDRTVILWDFNLDRLLTQSCTWLQPYLQTNPTLSSRDRHLCPPSPPTR